MLILFKLAVIATLIIFYQTGKHQGENGIKWALTGFIGFMLSFALAMSIIGETLIAILIACVAVYFTRVQLLRMTIKTKENH